MNKCTLKIIISIIVLIIVSFFYFRNNLQIPKYMYNRSSYAPNASGFTGIKIKDLIQSQNFYNLNRDKTIDYLSKVYPTSSDSFSSLGDLELASFYNSLSYYYVSNKNELPYPPQGWFFNNCSYQKDNQPLTFSDSDDSKTCLNAFNFISNNLNRDGPGLLFVDDKSLQRNIYFPNGISVTNKKGKDYWNYVSGQHMEWNYPKDWQKGFNNDSYVEITHTLSTPSNSIESPGWWWNMVTGSGIFLNLGKTLKSKNKLDALLQLLNITDKEFLNNIYNTTDIYKIIYGLIADCNNSQNYCNDTYTNCNNICSIEKETVLKKSELPLQNFYQELIRFRNENNIANEKLLVEGINAAINNKDYRLNRISQNTSLDETLFYLGLNNGFDTIQFIMDPNLNGFYVFEILDLRIPNTYLQDALKRNYKFFDQNKNYIPEFVDSSIQNFVDNGIISIRDPLDIFNENKVLKCNIDSILNKSWNNFYCETSLSNDYKI